MSIITAPSGIYKGWKQATVTEGPHKGVVAFGRDDEEARSAIARDIKSRESSGIGLPEEPPKGAIPAAKETAKAPETPAEEEKEKTYKGISIYKPARDLTDEEFEKITAPAGESMERRNEELAQYVEDSRFFVPLKPGEVGYQPSLPPDRQPLAIDWHSVRNFIKTGELPAQGKKIQKIADRLMEMSPHFSEAGAVKTAYRILMAIERGYYNDSLHPSNINSRKIFAELTGQKLPPGVSKTRDFVQGKTFPADFSKIEKTGEETPREPSNFARRLSPSEKKDLKFSEIRKASEDYYILDQERKLEKVEGQPVKISGFEKFDFFSRQAESGQFVTSEAITGASLGVDSTRQKSIDLTKTRLEEKGAETLEKAIVNTALNFGITPRYRIEKEGEREAPKREKRPIEQFEEDLRNTGAARIGNVDYKIHQNDALGYYFSKVENGIRITEGPVGPVRGMGQWSLQEARNRAIEDARSSLEQPEKETEPAKPETKEAQPTPEPPKFKIGDIVKVTGESGLNVGWGGKVTLVTESEGHQLVSVEGRRLRRSTDFELVRPEETVKASVIESPDLEYKRFVEGLSERGERRRHPAFIVPNPRQSPGANPGDQKGSSGLERKSREAEKSKESRAGRRGRRNHSPIHSLRSGQVRERDQEQSQEKLRLVLSQVENRENRGKTGASRAFAHGRADREDFR